MICSFCTWLGNRLRIDVDHARASLWKASDRWERENSNEYELWSEQSERSHELTERADAIDDADPEAAFRLYLEAAEAGSAWAIEMVGWHHETGTVVEADIGRALEYYHRAISAGSWMATIRYARILAAQGHYDRCNAVLEDGVQSDFKPAYFWLAWLRYRRSPTRRTCREIRPLLEYAAGKGHPIAEMMLARLMMRGKLGIRDIPAGLRLSVKIAARFNWETGAGDAAAPPATGQVGAHA